MTAEQPAPDGAARRTIDVTPPSRSIEQPVDLNDLCHEYVPPADREDALSRLAAMPADYRGWSDAGWVPVPVGLLRALAPVGLEVAEQPGPSAVVVERLRKWASGDLDGTDVRGVARDVRAVLAALAPSRPAPAEQDMRAAGHALARVADEIQQGCPLSGRMLARLEAATEAWKRALAAARREPGDPMEQLRAADSAAAPGFVWGGGRAGGPADQAAGSVPDPGSDPDGEVHRMLPGSHERPGGPECRCGAPWSRWEDRCARQVPGDSEVPDPGSDEPTPREQRDQALREHLRTCSDPRHQHPAEKVAAAHAAARSVPGQQPAPGPEDADPADFLRESVQKEAAAKAAAMRTADVWKIRADLVRAAGRQLVGQWRERSRDLLADWQDYDSHDGHDRHGQGIALSNAADELARELAAGPVPSPEVADDLPEPDEHVEVDGDDGSATIPTWTLGHLGVEDVAAWPDGVEIGGELIDRADVLAEVELDARKILAAGAWHRRLAEQQGGGDDRGRT